MNVSKNLKKFFAGRMNAIFKVLERPDRKFSSTDYHNLRVEIKRIRAMFSLLEYSLKKFKQKENFTPYLKIFRQAGQVRELQLQLAMLKKFTAGTVLNHYFTTLRRELREEENKFSNLIQKKLIKRLNKKGKAITAFLNRIPKSDVLKFLRKKIEYIEHLLKAEYLAKSEVHELRKKIKELYYLQRIFQPKSQRYIIADDFQELLGEWHDCMVISNDLLRDILSKKHSPAETKQLESLERKISVKADKLFKTIHTSRFKYLEAHAQPQVDKRN